MAGPASAVCATTASYGDPLNGYGRVNVGKSCAGSITESQHDQDLTRPKTREGRTWIATIFLSVAGPNQIWAQTVPGRLIDIQGPITSGFSRRLASVAMSSPANASRAVCVRARG